MNINILKKYKITKIVDNLYLGNIYGAYDLQSLLSNNIKVIINVTDDVKCLFVNMKDNYGNYMFKYYNINIKDDNVNIIKYFNDVYNVIDFYLSKNISVFVHCYAGISRSASIIISYLMKKQHKNLHDTYNFVKSKRDIVNPNIYFINQLNLYSNQIC